MSMSVHTHTAWSRAAGGERGGEPNRGITLRPKPVSVLTAGAGTGEGSWGLELGKGRDQKVAAERTEGNENSESLWCLQMRNPG